MKKAKKAPTDELRAEYDLSKLSGGVRGRYYKRYQAGTNLALLLPDVRAAFPTDQAVNAALREIIRKATKGKKKSGSAA